MNVVTKDINLTTIGPGGQKILRVLRSSMAVTRVCRAMESTYLEGTRLAFRGKTPATCNWRLDLEVDV